MTRRVISQEKDRNNAHVYQVAEAVFIMEDEFVRVITRRERHVDDGAEWRIVDNRMVGHVQFHNHVRCRGIRVVCRGIRRFVQFIM